MTPRPDDPTSHTVPPQHRLHCGAFLDAVGDPTGGHDRPSPGDPIACCLCGAVCTVDAGGRLRPFTEKEWKEIEVNPEVMSSIRRVCGAIRVIKQLHGRRN